MANAWRKGGMRLAALLVSAALLGGCVGGPSTPLPVDNYYRLSATTPARTWQQPLLAGTLVVAPLVAAGVVADRPLLYRVSGRSGVLRQYHTHLWSRAPAEQVQDVLAAHLRQVHVADRVVTERARVQADYTLFGRLLAWEQVPGEETARVVVSLELGVRREADGALLLLETVSGELSQPSGDETVHGAVTTGNRLLGQLIDRFTQRLAGAVAG